MTAYAAGRATRYPTIGGITIYIEMGGKYADGSQPPPIAFGDTSAPKIRMNVAAIQQLGDLVAWKEFTAADKTE